MLEMVALLVLNLLIELAGFLGLALTTVLFLFLRA